jgi:hypothetical protein
MLYAEGSLLASSLTSFRGSATPVGTQLRASANRVFVSIREPQENLKPGFGFRASGFGFSRGKPAAP